MVMTLEEKYERWERFARLLSEGSFRDSRESRKQTVLLGAYVGALREYDAAKLAVDANPQDLESTDRLTRARESLDRARGELKHQTAKRSRLPA